jgi:iron complex outermembrane receptor protein
MKTGVGDFTLAGTFYHNSGFFWEPNNRLSQPEYNLLNGSLSWDSTDRHFGVQLWMRNITDQRYYAFAQTSETDAQVSFAAPRTFGFTLTARQ